MDSLGPSEDLLGAWSETIALIIITESREIKTLVRITPNALKSAL
jgi:hypothetical protein